MTRQKSLFLVMLLFFFISGACGLVYEVVWQRMLHLIFGESAFATATALAAFMAGLALGSLYFGRKVEDLKNPMRLYAFL